MGKEGSGFIVYKSTFLGEEFEKSRKGTHMELTVPVPMQLDLDMFCISLRPPRKVELINAPPKVVGCVERVANEVNSLYTGKSYLETPSKDKLGVIQFTMAADVFVCQSGRKAATMGKFFCIRILEELHKMGYDLQTASDLTRVPDSVSSLFFKKVASERPAARVVCIAPRKEDKIVLMNHNESMKSMVDEAIKNAWPSGIQRHEDQEVFGHTLLDIKMKGNPWRASAANIDNMRIINLIVENLSKINLRLVGAINIKGGRRSCHAGAVPGKDSLFFMEDVASSNAKFCSISLCGRNRLRLFDCKEETRCVRRAIDNSGFKIEEQWTKEHYVKMQLNRMPWFCSGQEAVWARQLVGRISEAMLQRGWALTDAIHISRREEDKSMLLFRRCIPTTATIACICLTSTDNLRLIDFSSEDERILKTCIMENYLPGVKELETTEYCLGTEGKSVRFELKGRPWSSWDWGLHARSLLLHLFAAAFSLGFQIAASADVGSMYEYDGDGNPYHPLDVHSIYLVKMPPQGEGVFESSAQTVKVNDNSLPSYEEAMK